MFYGRELQIFCLYAFQFDSGFVRVPRNRIIAIIIIMIIIN
jgi:hypothetical protein